MAVQSYLPSTNDILHTFGNKSMEVPCKNSPVYKKGTALLGMIKTPSIHICTSM